ncbi:class I SAM-dependent methyltransferase [Janthinobacterium fluminis]|uniref:Class I SAM-dependent methyltransferase n=1 Tax=Janthinobacterium fluminis TaxID=2987524 RepID=A0ABT5K032_9BURK|nr:class I SAM-dependent methyltransferase [Janthinobacterium fluminis]MDC8757676.1 class I SAM-dependent methyltransferase [Janthinobacterium fluminis]
MITEQLAQFYAVEAQEYDRVYANPQVEDDLDELHDKIDELFSGHKVLEIACGTGYWTQTLDEVAESVLATDINPAMLDLAKTRGFDTAKVQFSLADAYELPADIGSFTACFAGFWWSHVKREDQQRFLAHLRARLGKDTLLVLVDDSYVDGHSDVIARTDAEGNTYQFHTAADGQRYEIVKNFPSDSMLRKRLASAVREIRILRLEHYWLLSCRLK